MLVQSAFNVADVRVEFYIELYCNLDIMLMISMCLADNYFINYILCVCVFHNGLPRIRPNDFAILCLVTFRR